MQIKITLNRRKQDQMGFCLIIPQHFEIMIILILNSFLILLKNEISSIFIIM